MMRPSAMTGSCLTLAVSIVSMAKLGRTWALKPQTAKAVEESLAELTEVAA